MASEMIDAVAGAIYKALAGRENCLITRVGADAAARAAIEAIWIPIKDLPVSLKVAFPDTFLAFWNGEKVATAWWCEDDRAWLSCDLGSDPLDPQPTHWLALSGPQQT